MKGKAWVVLGLVTCLLFAGASFLTVYANKAIAINYFPVNEIDEDQAVSLQPKQRVVLPKIDGRELTCTGMTYDENDGVFWACNYGKDTENDSIYAPSIVCLDASFRNVLKILPLDLEKSASLQGLTYDKKTDSLWFTTGNQLINIAKTGETLSRFANEYSYNGLLYNPSNDGFYVLCYQRYLLSIDRRNTILERQVLNYRDQDQLYFDSDGHLFLSVGNDYKGDKNYVIKYDLESMKPITTYKVVESYAVEGIVSMNGLLYVCNDGYYHDAKIKENYVAVYTL